jgi:hypothetical protein
MQLRRLTLVALVLGVTLPALPAVASTKPKPKAKPSCKQISDDEGDGRSLAVSSPTLDVLSADISSGAKEVTATLRLKSADVEHDNMLPGGAIWNFNVTIDGIKYSFHATWSTVVSPTRQLTGGLTAGSNPSSPEATFRRVGNDFVWTVSRAAFPSLKKAKQYIYVTSATSGANSFGGDGAQAKPGTKYLDRSPSCLPSK